MPDPRKSNPDPDVPPIPGREPKPIDEPDPDRLPDEEPNPNPDEVRKPPLQGTANPPRPVPDPQPPMPPGPLPDPALTRRPSRLGEARSLACPRGYPDPQTSDEHADQHLASEWTAGQQIILFRFGQRSAS